jgi:hypothetical protein
VAVTTDAGSAGAALVALGSVGGLLGVAQVLVLVFYLRAVALMLEEGWLVLHALYLAIVAGGAALVGCCNLGVMLPTTLGAVEVKDAPELGVLAVLLYLVGGLLWLGTHGWYAFVLYHVRQAVVNQTAD